MRKAQKAEVRRTRTHARRCGQLHINVGLSCARSAAGGGGGGGGDGGGGGATGNGGHTT